MRRRWLLVGGCFAMVVAAALAQIGSAYPTAGGLYHWSSILGGRGWGWATAWINLAGLVFIVAAVDVGVYALFQGLVAPILGLDTSSWGFWTQTATVLAIVVSQGLFNHLGIKVTTRLTDVAGYLVVGVAVLLTATFLFSGYLSGLACLTSTSRMIFAFSRDGGLPGSVLWKRVSPRWRTPVFAIWRGAGGGLDTLLAGLRGARLRLRLVP